MHGLLENLWGTAWWAQGFAHKLIRRRSGDGKAYYVYADPNYCQCMHVGSESAYATYKTLVQQQDEAMALQEEREHENFQGDK